MQTDQVNLLYENSHLLVYNITKKLQAKSLQTNLDVGCCIVINFSLILGLFKYSQI